MEQESLNVRKWATYNYWKSVYKQLKGLNKFQTLLFIHQLLESRIGYHYIWIYEVNDTAIKQVIKDLSQKVKNGRK